MNTTPCSNAKKTINNKKDGGTGMNKNQTLSKTILWVDDLPLERNEGIVELVEYMERLGFNSSFLSLDEYDKLLVSPYLNEQHIIIHDNYLDHWRENMMAESGVKKLREAGHCVIMHTSSNKEALKFEFDGYIAKCPSVDEFELEFERILMHLSGPEGFSQLVSIGTVGGEEIGYIQLMDKRIVFPIFLKPLSARKRELQGCIISRGCDSDLITYMGEQYIPIGSRFLENDLRNVDKKFHTYNLTPGFLDNIWHEEYEKETFELLGSVGKREGVEVMVSLIRRHVTNEFITDNPSEIGKIFWFNFEDLAISWGAGVLKNHPHFKNFDIGNYVQSVVDMSMFGDGFSQYAYPKAKGRKKVKVS